MTRKEKVKHFIIENRIYIGSFLLPFLIMTGICILFKVEPFGDQSLAIIDALHQYMPFFSEYHEKIRTLDSFFYSWNGGLGHNFLSLWAYYLSSPLNLLLVLLPKRMLNLGFSWLLVLKISLTGLTTGAFLIHRSNKKNGRVLVFSTAFALSNYMIGYSWNIMWMDAILMMPLILIGFDKMMEERDGKWYSICLALAMIGNYYIAFMLCIFLVLWFIFYEHKGIGKFIANGFWFAWHSLLSACLAGAVLLPAYMGLMKTASAKKMSLPKHEWFTRWTNLFVTHLAGTEPMTNNNFDGNANLYVCMLSFLLVFVYIFGRRITWKQKGKRVLFLGILLFSMNEKILNFIWHGFHDQYGIPNRFVFLYIFLIVFTGFEAMEKIKAMRLRHIIPAMGSALLAVGLFTFFAEGEKAYVQMAISAGLILLYGSILLCYSLRKINLRLCRTMICIFATVEIISTGIYGFACNGQIDIPKFYGDTKGIEDLKQSIEEKELVRTDLVAAKMLDEAVWHNLKAVGMFGSTVNGTTVSMMDYLGFFTGANEYLYKGATPLTDVLLNVKYNIRRHDDVRRNHFYIVDMYEDMELLQNPYETSIGYGITGNLEEWNYNSVYPFRVQNRFVETAYGMDGLFQELKVSEPVTRDVQAEATGSSGEYRIRYEESHEDNLTFSIPVEVGQDVYLHYDGSRVEKAAVIVGEETRVCKKLNSEIFHVGLIEDQKEIKVRFQLKDDDVDSGVVRLSAAAFDNEMFEKLHAKMMEHAVNVDSYTSDEIDGRITMEKDGWVLFSIPYDEGWKALVDGEEAEITPVAEGLLAIKAPEGNHSIRLHFTAPGFYEGMCLSLIGMLLFILTWLWKKFIESRVWINKEAKCPEIQEESPQQG